jgi:glycosyltransferase involved in cell wall biosynthesis
MRSTVSIIVPCYNEQEMIGSLLGAIAAQTYPRELLEVVIADGMSQDGTRGAIRAFGETHPGLSVRVVDNSQRTIPSGLNLAVREARGEIVIRLDAHSIPIPEYVERCVQDLENGKGSNVGGVWIIRPGGEGWIAAGIAAAAGHPLGAGDASYRLNAKAGEVDTVPFGAFRRSLLGTLGGFDESLLTNEDYEFNTRIRRAGGVIWLDPEIRSLYVARSSLPELAKQYWRYGFWKLRMLLRYPDSLRWRQAIPPLFVLSVLVLAVTAVLWRPALLILGVDLILYLGAVTLAGAGMAIRSRQLVLMPGAALAMMTMHTAWGSGFLWSLAGRLLHLHD